MANLKSTLIDYITAKELKPSTAQDYKCKLGRLGPEQDLIIANITEAKLSELFHKLSTKSQTNAAAVIRLIRLLCAFADPNHETTRTSKEQASEKLRASQRRHHEPEVQTVADMDLSLGGITFGALADAYIEHHAKKHCRRWKDQERMLRMYLSSWRHIPASAIRRHDIQKLHGVVGEKNGQTTANRVVQLIKTVFFYGFDSELLITPNPACRVRLFRLQSRERFLEVEEIQRLITALDSLRNETTRDFLVMCLLTGARRANVASMSWKDVSLERRMWRIPLTKNGLSQFVPLTEQAMEILRRRKIGSNPYVFPSDRSSTGHLTKPEEAWRVVLERSGLQDVRIHDLRRTLASWQAMTGANISVIAATLNHKDLKSTQIYARLQIEPIRQAMETATAAMLQVETL